MADWLLSKEAANDLDGITEYTTRHFGEKQARLYAAEIKRAIQVAADFPLLARPHITGAGEVFQRYNVGQHAIFYQQTAQTILVVRIMHGMMDFDRHLD